MPGMKSVVGMGGSGNARELAEMLRQMGRGRDTILAHITPEEAQMLMDMGGSGEINPNTGLPEFQEDYGQLLASEFNEFDPYMGQPVTSASGGISPEAEAYYTGQTGAPFDRDMQTAAEQNTQGQMDIGFGPGRFAPEYTPRDVAGMAPDQFQRMTGGGEPGFLQTAAQGIEDTAAQYRDLARQYPTVAKMLSTGATTLPALINAIRARREAEKSAAEFRRLGEPLRAQGEALRQQALSGTLTPQQAAAQEAARARLRQQASSRGATTGTQQAMIEGQLARSRSEQSQTNLNNAVKLLNLANAYDEEAIRTSLAANQRINDRLANVFANLGQAAAASTAPNAPEQQRPPVTQRPQLA